MITKWILIYFIITGYKGGTQYIEFKTEAGCKHFATEFVEKTKGFSEPSLRCYCIEVKE